MTLLRVGLPRSTPKALLIAHVVNELRSRLSGLGKAQDFILE